MSNNTGATALKYLPEIFDTKTVADAKQIILTQERPDAPSEARWAAETPYTVNLISGLIPLDASMTILDYGCGVGRMSKALIDHCGCRAIGVDISQSMRDMARDYVASERFMALSPDECDVMIKAGMRVDLAICVWVLQHCYTPEQDIQRIAAALTRNAAVFVLNMPKRAIPVMAAQRDQESFAWATDNKDVRKLLLDRFDLEAQGEPNAAVKQTMAETGAYWLSLRNRADASS
jgi:2-polyprenyl-3-methyl-5-hydroxy-6-metoxy-1,4-benzoquinol methylase